MNTLIKKLKNVPLFKGINENELKSMLGCLSAAAKNYSKGEQILCSGDKITSIGLVTSGSVLITKDDFWGNRTIISNASAGSLFGEAFACSAEKTLSVSAYAAEDASILFIDINKIINTCSSACAFHSRLIQNLISVLADKNILLTNKIDHISQRKLRNKILSYLSEVSLAAGSSRFTIPYDRQQLADYLSADRSALSNELCKLRDEGVIEFKKNRFTLL